MQLIATIIYSVWNAVNDPLIGYFTNKGAPFSARLGRRFPWIILGLVITGITFIMIFFVPQPLIDQVATHPLPVFLWMVISICIFDTSYSLWELNYQSIFPDKFRTQDVRAKSAGISTAVGVLGIASGFIIPPLFFSYGVIDSYRTSALVVGAITLFGILLLIQGITENAGMIERFKAHREEHTAAGEDSSRS